MRRAPSGAGSVCLEVARSGDVVYGEDYGAASPAVLGCAAEALGDSHLVSYLPGVAGCLARRVARAVGGLCGDRCGRFHARRGAPCLRLTAARCRVRGLRGALRGAMVMGDLWMRSASTFWMSVAV